jgi:hypothetical protein
MAKQKAKPKKGEPAAIPPEEDEYKPTPREEEIMKAYFKAKDARGPAAKIRIKKNAAGAYEVGTDHEDATFGHILFMRSLGVLDIDFSYGLQIQIANISGKEPSEMEANFVRSVIVNIQPRDALEVMLATQMAAVHMASMTAARKLNRSEYLEQQDSASNIFNKLTRTFTTQMEALKRYRSTGQQKVTVEHVTVQSGGQAIVGNVSHGAPASDAGQAPRAAPPAISAPIETTLTSVAGGEPQKKARLIS